MQQLLDRFVFRIGPTTVAFVKSTGDNCLWCAHTMQQSSFRRLCVQQTTKIAWCVPGLRGFLGLVNYYHRFLPNLSSVMHPLNQLLEKDHTWEWSHGCEDAVKESNRLVTSEHVLAHYDPDLPVRVACDASPLWSGGGTKSCDVRWFRETCRVCITHSEQS